MIREKFTAISEELGYQYDYTEEFIRSLGGSNIPISYHHMVVEYKSVTIKLEYEFGNKNLAEIKSVIATDKQLDTIQITTNSQMKRLFSKDKYPFKIKCKNELLRSYLKNALETSKYAEIVRNTQFEPEINCYHEDGNYILRTTFYMGFDDKENSIIPSIELHKKIIDKVLR